MSGKFVPALIAGVVTFIIGFIFGILGRFVPFVGCCACLMPLIGGVFAVFLYSNKANSLSPGTGASVGLMAGGVYSILSLFITPISLYLQWDTIQIQLEQATRDLKRSGMELEGGVFVVAIVIGVILGFAIILGLFALGGLIGGAIFKKEGQTQAPFEPPMPPASYGV